MRRTIIAATAITLLALAGCGKAPEAPAEAAPATTASVEPTYDKYDCQALLERNYDDDNVHDASDEAECNSLSRDEYVDAVKKVITGRKDEILVTAANEDAWDVAWDETSADQQQTVCDRLVDDGPEVVGKEMADSTGDDETEQIAMARYILNDKC
ncbi:hypothetical protein ACN2WE_05130 [Streptomyces sp. cg28]|uniref:hypothetical protein n=1 Tax=Streptomyces sp. cg28 TaxID=3403457 RepID=UPI003B220D0C